MNNFSLNLLIKFHLYRINQEKIGELRGLINSSFSNRTHEILHAICGKTRFKIVILLNEEKRGLNVTELSSILNSTLTKISHQLSILRKDGIVEFTGQNRERIYKLADHKLKKYFELFF